MPILKISGGPLIDLGVHDFDLAEWMTRNKMKIIYASEDNGIYNIKGSSGDIHLGFTIGWDNEVQNSIIIDGGKEILKRDELEKNRYPSAYRLMINSFLECFSGEKNDVPTVESGLRALEHAYKVKNLLF